MFESEKRRIKNQLRKRNKRQFRSLCKTLRLKRYNQKTFCRRLRKKRGRRISKPTVKYFRIKDSEKKRLLLRLQRKDKKETHRGKSEPRTRIEKIIRESRRTGERRGRQNKLERRELLCLEPVAQHCVKNCGKA